MVAFGDGFGGLASVIERLVRRSSPGEPTHSLSAADEAIANDLLDAADVEDFRERLSFAALATAESHQSSVDAWTSDDARKAIKKFSATPADLTDFRAALGDAQAERLAAVGRALLFLATVIVEQTSEELDEFLKSRKRDPQPERGRRTLEDLVYDPSIPMQLRRSTWAMGKGLPAFIAIAAASYRRKRLDAWLALQLVDACREAFDGLVAMLQGSAGKTPDGKTDTIAEWFAKARQNGGVFYTFGLDAEAS